MLIGTPTVDLQRMYVSLLIAIVKAPSSSVCLLIYCCTIRSSNPWKCLKFAFYQLPKMTINSLAISRLKHVFCFSLVL